MVDVILGRAIPEPAVETVEIWGDGAAIVMSNSEFHDCNGDTALREDKSCDGMLAVERNVNPCTLTPF
jgi:hypothetical protein